MKLSGLKVDLKVVPTLEPSLEVTGTIRITTLLMGDAVGLERISLLMTCAERRKVRRRLVAPDGLELGLALPTGTVLEPGTLLHQTEHKAYVVEAALEEVALIRVGSWLEAACIAHAIGNLHRDIDPQPDGLLALWDAPLELLLLRMNANFERTHRPFLGRPSWEH